MLKPKYQVSIEVFGQIAQIRFGRPADADVLSELQGMSVYEGVTFAHESHGDLVTWAPVYDCSDVLKEIVARLKKHNINSINIVNMASRLTADQIEEILQAQ